jgi:hypothetical protein
MKTLTNTPTEETHVTDLSSYPDTRDDTGVEHGLEYTE